ncbi:UBX domain-containing protein 6-like [Ylistrum balloti]|uniref:UBX domain-containing protein 6-like n=1 Tax=Ylistrum balloti TaxID=509963 RepID=UPI002905ED2A|nr:UBX domain-containing protein 6-like [Ylistrum balloti]
MAAIKKFFQKRKLDVTFKRAGDGHRLTDDTRSTPRTMVTEPIHPVSRQQTSREAQKAAEAAMIRNQGQNTRKSAAVSQRAKMKQEMESELKRQEQALAAAEVARAGPTKVELDSAPVLSQILYTCPDIGPAVLPKNEMEACIEEFLLKQIAEEPEMTSALMIHTLNKDKEKVRIGIETLVKILGNIIANPGEEKFRKIRLTTKAFTEKIEPLRGSDEFLQAAGFHIMSQLVNETEENFYIMDEVMAQDTERLSGLKEVLLAAEPIKPQLDRALKVYHPSQHASKFDIPNEFYNVNPEEIKKEQQRRHDAVEKLGMLRTKAMRERDELRELRKYRFTLIRVRLPNGVLLQGTFKAQEKVSSLFSYVRENLANDWIPFQLLSVGQKLEETDTFAEAGLVPAVVVTFSWDQALMADLKAQQGAGAEGAILKQEIMSLIETL